MDRGAAAWELAQFNVARLLAPIDSPRLAEFVALLAPLNALAEAAPGFVWRLQDDSGNATAMRPFGEEVIVNLSVWRDVDSLEHYVYRSDHARALTRRREWFAPMKERYLVLWWVPAGRRPSLDEAEARLARLRAGGASPEAFTLKRHFPPPGA